MAYSRVVKDNALNLFIEGKSIEDISEILNVPNKTLYNWRRKGDWDAYLRIGNIEIARSVEQEVYKLVKEMIDTGKVGDASEVDKLVKLTKALERISPNRQIYNSLYILLEGITDYVNRARDPEMTRIWQKHLRPIGEHLKQAFAPREG